MISDALARLCVRPVMIKITVFNDTDKDWQLHAGSERGIGGETLIQAGRPVSFRIPKRAQEVFVKVWSDMVLVRGFRE
jgi:hypothetical protein